MEFTGQSFMRNPVPGLEKLRLEGPLVRRKVPIIGNIWITTTQEAANLVLKDNDHFSMRRADGKVTGVQWWMPRIITRLTSNMLTMDEPNHTRLRSIVDQAFHRRNILELETRINKLATHLADALFSEPNGGELVEKFARVLPLAVICEVLGLPQEDHALFSKWASSLTQVSGVWSFVRLTFALRPLTAYLERKIEEARSGNGNGLIRELAEVQSKGNSFSSDEILSMVFLLLMAGHETTTHAISGGVLALLQNPDQKERLLADWSRLDLAVEEILRFASPVQFTKPRNVKRDCTICGVSLSKGEKVMPMLLAANFDPAIFDNPESFDIERKPNRHMEFGTGIHFCLGHQLARIELKAAIRALWEHYPNLELAVDERDIQWVDRFGLRALRELRVKKGG